MEDLQFSTFYRVFWHIRVIFKSREKKPVLSLPPNTAELIQHKSPPKIKAQFAENRHGKFQPQGRYFRILAEKIRSGWLKTSQLRISYNGKDSYQNLRATWESREEGL